MKSYLLPAILVLVCCDSPGNKTPPETAAKKFAATLQLDVQGEPSCTQIDTDNDGYVSCTIALKGQDGPPKTMSIQCAALGAGSGCVSRAAEGCKETVPQVRAGQQ